MSKTKLLHFSVTAYKESVREYQKDWKALDNVLYQLCKDHPRNDLPPSVYAKVFIIGRSYSSGIERLVSKTKEQPSGMTRVADELIAHGQTVDRLFEHLRSIRLPMTTTAWEQIVSSHGQFVAMLKPLTADGKSPRSFASKYLHFHFPIVPIYDSKAEWSLMHFEGGPEVVRLPTSENPNGADGSYSWLVERFGNLWEQVRSSGQTPTVKHIDHYLSDVADRNW
ncbi:MAG: hypothetical protein WCD12_22225 [Candidatus Binatus sp.]|uniref:hypothetical protein n=1 Tax=Candidatus Binatus sp. TaxID=2811406 RepID=UPI003C71A8BD